MQNKYLRFALALAVCGLLAAPLAAAVPPGIDLWRTPGDGSTFTDFSENPIPAGFFCEESQPFTGRIVFEGVPVATEKLGELGRTDIIVERLDEARFNGRGVATTRIRVRALSLASVSPIRTECGLYNVMVKLDGTQPITRMRIVRTGEDGGYFVAPLMLQTKLVFTPVAGRGRETRELVQTVDFKLTPRIPWVDRPTTAGRPTVVKVDTDGDLQPDTELRGASGFVAGAGADTNKQATTAPQCHCDPSQKFPGGGYYVYPTDGSKADSSLSLTTLCVHLHCPNPVTVNDGL
jgi:hypothetical protein